MHELFHFYIQREPGPIKEAPQSSATEVYAQAGLNGLVALPAPQSLSTPDIYTTYAASRFAFVLSPGLCTFG